MRHRVWQGADIVFGACRVFPGDAERNRSDAWDGKSLRTLLGVGPHGDDDLGTSELCACDKLRELRGRALVHGRDAVDAKKLVLEAVSPQPSHDAAKTTNRLEGACALKRDVSDRIASIGMGLQAADEQMCLSHPRPRANDAHPMLIKQPLDHRVSQWPFNAATIQDLIERRGIAIPLHRYHPLECISHN
ncbi:MAG: hypothetical protein LKH08_03325 [Atopobiaceae bacterium]|nr:hypothetical protein [Atopobiaceae bacterium]MCI1389798.1 hypothetical protein [Atopobiaceae bacterium]MCI1431940.1 hypothetical protein [Atopobiaceae bacterium]MCI1470376.1 hypothetical protein [Atopobiaceae bacterium]